MIETDCLILRPYPLDDYEPYYAMVCDPSYSFRSRLVISREEAWHRLLRELSMSYALQNLRTTNA